MKWQRVFCESWTKSPPLYSWHDHIRTWSDARLAGRVRCWQVYTMPRAPNRTAKKSSTWLRRRATLPIWVYYLSKEFQLWREGRGHCSILYSQEGEDTYLGQGLLSDNSWTFARSTVSHHKGPKYNAIWKLKTNCKEWGICGRIE